jgi:hypothetical protein
MTALAIILVIVLLFLGFLWRLGDVIMRCCSNHVPRSRLVSLLPACDHRGG